MHESYVLSFIIVVVVDLLVIGFGFAEFNPGAATPTSLSETGFTDSQNHQNLLHNNQETILEITSYFRSAPLNSHIY